MNNAVSVDLCFGLNATLLDTGSWFMYIRVSSSVDDLARSLDQILADGRSV